MHSHVGMIGVWTAVEFESSGFESSFTPTGQYQLGTDQELECGAHDFFLPNYRLRYAFLAVSVKRADNARTRLTTL